MLDEQEKRKDRESRENIAQLRTDVQERIAESRLKHQKERAKQQQRTAENRLKHQKEQAEKKDHQKKVDEENKRQQLEDQKIEQAGLARTRGEFDLMAQKAVTDRELLLEGLQQGFYEKKRQIDYEFDAKYENLEFQRYRLQSREDTRKELSIIAAETSADIEKYRVELAGDLAKMKLAGSVKRQQTREKLEAKLYEIKAGLEASLAKQKQQNKHEMDILKAKHEYAMEMEILKEELRREAKEMGVEEISEIMSQLDNDIGNNI